MLLAEMTLQRVEKRQSDSHVTLCGVHWRDGMSRTRFRRCRARPATTQLQVELSSQVVMDSPEPSSPASRSSSESPPPEEMSFSFQVDQNYPVGGTRESYPSASAGKRRLPVSSGSGSNAKSRRREEPLRRQTGTGTGSSWTQSDYTRPQRDELLDTQLVDKIRAGTSWEFRRCLLDCS
jgi:hypothetical protein